ncbi:MAG: TIM barrel protein, partial [Crenarchaeota archaeon]|nr:TIM barrel protein [Thermoproteota archaeon]
CIELRQGWDKNIKDFTDADLRRVKRIAQSAGLEVVCVSPPLFKCKIDDEQAIKEHLRFLRRIAEIAKFFDTELVRGFTFWSKGTVNQYWDIILEKMNEALDICRSEGVIFALENEHATFTGTGREASELAKTVDSQSFSLLWDPGNAFCAGEKPYPDGYLCVRDRVVHVHIKDAVLDPAMAKNRFVAVGKGEIDYRGQLKALVEDGYSGCVSIETHYKVSGDGEKSTRETCQGIVEILRELGEK